MKHFWKRYDGNCILRQTMPATILGLEKSIPAKQVLIIFGKKINCHDKIP